MNRFKKEEIKQYNKKTKGMSETDRKNYNLVQEFQKSLEKMVMELQSKLFPEEKDFFYDSGVDANRRRLGENPMSEEYVIRMNNKRVKLGFLPLSKDGLAQDSSKTFEYCKKLITKELDYKTIE